MRRVNIFIFFLLLAFTAPRAAAQGGFTTVTGTITDPNGLKWSCGTISAQLITAGGAAPTLNGGGFTTVTAPVNLGCPTTPGTGASGSFTMRLADSGVISPSTTTWQFTVNLAPGIPPPAGTGPQSFTFTSAINCSTNTPATCTSNSMDISSQLSGPAPAISAGGGLTKVSTLPASCTLTSPAVQLSVAPGGIYVCQIGSNGTGTYVLDGQIGTAILVSSYGVTAATAEDCLATFTNGSGTVTLSASAVTPTAAMVGWSMQGSGSCTDGPSYTSVMPRCTITSVNSGSRTLTGTGCAANANASGAANQHIVFGPIEDTQLTASEAPLAATTGPCPSVQFPSGVVYVVQPHFNSATCNRQYTGPSSTGLQAQGYGRMDSLLGMSSDFNYAGCPLFSGVNTCFFGKQGVTKQNMGITGFQHPQSNPAASTTIINETIDDFTFNFSLTGMGSALSNLTCVTFSGLGTTDWMIIADGCGGTSLSTAGGECIECVFFNSANPSSVQGGAPWATKQGGYGSGGSGLSLLSVSSGALFSTDNDVWLWNGAVGQFGIDCSGNCYVTGMHFGTAVPNANDQPIRVNGTGVVVAVSNKYTPGSSVQNITMNGGVYHDGCGNIYQTVKVNNLAGGGGTGTFVPCDDGTSTYGVAPVANMLNCASSASPAVCGGFISGSVVIAASATTVTINTTSIGTNDEVILTADDTLGTKLGVTCNSTIATLVGGLAVTARTAGTSFQVTSGATPAVNPLCFSYTIKK